MFRPIPFPRIHPPRTIARATTTLVLLLLTFTLNFSAIWLRWHLRRRAIR